MSFSTSDTRERAHARTRTHGNGVIKTHGNSLHDGEIRNRNSPNNSLQSVIVVHDLPCSVYPTTYEDYCKAYHEAGHCVVSFLKKIKFEYVTITPDEKSGGHVHHEKDPNEYDGAVICYAGPLAEARYKWSSITDTGHEGDTENCRSLIREYIIKNSLEIPEEELHAAFKREARRLIKNHWFLVCITAQALIERKTLMYDEFLEVLGSEP